MQLVFFLVTAILLLCKMIIYWDKQHIVKGQNSNAKNPRNRKKNSYYYQQSNESFFFLSCTKLRNNIYLVVIAKRCSVLTYYFLHNRKNFCFFSQIKQKKKLWLLGDVIFLSKQRYTYRCKTSILANLLSYIALLSCCECFSSIYISKFLNECNIHGLSYNLFFVLNFSVYILFYRLKRFT
jgi:hypothetical protein